MLIFLPFIYHFIVNTNYCKIYLTFFLFFFGQFSEQLWLFTFFFRLNGTEHGSQSSLTTRDRELVSVLKVRNRARGFDPETSESAVCHSINYTTNKDIPRPLTPQSVTLPTIQRIKIFKICYFYHRLYRKNFHS